MYIGNRLLVYRNNANTVFYPSFHPPTFIFIGLVYCYTCMHVQIIFIKSKIYYEFLLHRYLFAGFLFYYISTNIGKISNKFNEIFRYIIKVKQLYLKGV